MTLRLVLCLFLVFEANCLSCRLRPAKDPGNGNGLKFDYDFCSDKSGDGLGFIILDNTGDPGKFPQDNLCIAVPKTQTYHTHEYIVSAEFLNDKGWGHVNTGHPSLVFNMVDSANYDFMFFRLHNNNACYGYGYVINGNMVYNGRNTGRCPHGAPKGRTWHEVKLHVAGHHTRVYINKQRLVTIPHHFQNIARSGPAILSGWKNRAFFRKFQVKPFCHGHFLSNH